MEAPRSEENDATVLKWQEREGRDTGATGQPLWYHAESDFRHAIELRIYLHHLAPKKHERVLDAGCGMGRIAIEVASRVSSLTCIDFAFVPLKVLCQRQRERGLSNISAIQADLSMLPLSSERFDLVYCTEVLQHIPSEEERIRVLRGMYSSLMPGGRCLVSVIAWNFRVRRSVISKELLEGTGNKQLFRHYFAAAEMQYLLVAAGFRDVRIRGFIFVPDWIQRHFLSASLRIEDWFSRVRLLSFAGWYLIATGIR